MSAKLSRGDGKLVVELFGETREQFNDSLAKVKTIPGRRYNPDSKTWELPDDLETLLKATTSLEPDVGVELLAEIRDAKEQLAEELTTLLPDDAELRIPWADLLAPKQRAGIDFLAEHPHSLLADEMGSGKTVQAISTVYERAWRTDDITAQHPEVLVVCPNSVTGVWARELEQWAGIESTIIDAKTKPKRLAQFEKSSGWVIVNWEKIRLIPELADRNWGAVIADEAHRAKNRNAKQTKALWKLTAPIQLALTGTPVLNSPDELWPILKWLRPEQYTSYWAFYYTYVDYYEGGYRAKKKIVTGVKNADALRFELSDKMVRRTKRDIHADIPKPFPPQEINVAMKPRQAALYKEAEDSLWLDIEQAIEDPELLQRAADKVQAGATDRAILELLIPDAGARLTRLRQIATSPALLGGVDESGKLDATIEIITDHPEQPFVVFCWYKDTVRLVIERLAREKIEARGFTGDTPPEDRPVMTQAFQAGEFDVIVCTIAAGGQGIDLYRSSECLMPERDWVPAINQQAIDRLDRKGQKSRVSTRFIQSSGTVDTGRIAPVNRLKQMIVSTILGADE